MTEADSTYVNAPELLTISLHHLDDAGTRRPIIEVPALVRFCGISRLAA
ncbi:hypothetical protein ACFW84_33945 [Streptomyces anulatus]